MKRKDLQVGTDYYVESFTNWKSGFHNGLNDHRKFTLLSTDTFDYIYGIPHAETLVVTDSSGQMLELPRYVRPSPKGMGVLMKDSQGNTVVVLLSVIRLPWDEAKAFAEEAKERYQRKKEAELDARKRGDQIVRSFAEHGLTAKRASDYSGALVIQLDLTSAEFILGMLDKLDSMES